MGNINNIASTGSQRISNIAPTKSKRYTFITCPSHQKPDTRILMIKTIKLVIEILKAAKFVFIIINFKVLKNYKRN
jgi:hypothetical protein